mmetsp:Transcript_48085/g.127311  ORF Transcript_48085/g.127311 Transcript_48085/m.127311 type:complete len:210 (+) Transcript_48085:172-801(+)
MVSIKCCETLRFAQLSSPAKVSGIWAGIANCTVGSLRSTPQLRWMHWHVDLRETHLAVSLGISQFDPECGFRPPPRLAARWRSSAPSLQVPLSFRGQGGHPSRCVSRALASCRKHQLQPPQRSAALPKTQRPTSRSSPQHLRRDHRPVQRSRFPQTSLPPTLPSACVSLVLQCRTPVAKILQVVQPHFVEATLTWYMSGARKLGFERIQ